jgi:cytochrome c-type biogenesis protein CcmH/NrfG
MNQELVLVVIGLAVAALVLRPLLRGRRTSARAGAVNPARDTGTVSPDELAELELDHSMGRVSDADYERWRGQISTKPVGNDVSDPVPAPADATSRAERLVAKWRNTPLRRCVNCGERPEPEARFCSNCGASLEA